MKEDLLEMNYQILEHYGLEKQAIIWIEELSELTKELTKRLRKGCFNEESLKNIKLEITDVQVSLDQLKEAIGYSEQEQFENYEFKVERALKGIKKDAM
jgi:hypothetical protein